MKKQPHIQIRTATNGLDYYVFCAANGRVLATSETYSKGKIERAVHCFIQDMRRLTFSEVGLIVDKRKKVKK